MNSIVASSNILCILPIRTAFRHNDWITTSIISFVSCASFVSHLAENHKHNMPGIGLSKRTSYILNRIDVLGAILTVFRLSYLLYNKLNTIDQFMSVILNNKYFILGSITSGIMGYVSEYDKYNLRYRNMYIITHSIWHLLIFWLMDYYLRNFIYI